MVKVEVEVDAILQVVVPLELEPGDRVLVMRGVIIGMIEGGAVREPRRRIDAKATPEPQAKPAWPQPDGVRASNDPSGARAQRRIEIVSIVKRHGPITARAISRRLAGNPKIGTEITALRNQGHIIGHKEDNQRFATYTTPTGNAEA